MCALGPDTRVPGGRYRRLSVLRIIWKRPLATRSEGAPVLLRKLSIVPSGHKPPEASGDAGQFRGQSEEAPVGMAGPHSPLWA